ncbi:eukaryotic translation initiation factor SUI1 family protein [Lentinus tigrinus ALCF2SS1-6]|uniref:Eukaryotic translation initiation factor SUI1 family protein n=1 Tax=Lentinus tigrinus ALCF2SS1-6 TaxID=1328759 RepID=A0A5C2SAH1_9APHY|nr:eukaryotic translation initiation factor SUI1 family protein [Lentinus tigrinus ALCF2SS1-6]
MFKKPLADLKTSAPLRSSDRRKLRQRVLQSYLALPPEEGDGLVPDGLQSQKFSTHLDDPGVVYLSPEGDPLWFTVGKGSEELIPTGKLQFSTFMYTLWKRPDLLPFLSTPAPVVPKLIGGADLMIPGDQLVSITQYHRDALGPPLAVGRMAVSSDTLRESEEVDVKGKAVFVLHTWKDALWDMGPSKKADPPAPRPIQVSSETEESAQPSGNTDTQEGTNTGENVPESVPDDGGNELSTAADGAAAPEGNGASTATLTPEDVSHCLRDALLQAIGMSLADVPPSTFPISASTFWSSYVLPARPAQALGAYGLTDASAIDVKHSTFKNVKSFLKASAKEGLLKLKETKGDVVVTAVYPQHPAVAGKRPHRTIGDIEAKAKKAEDREQKEKEAEEKRKGEIHVAELWKPFGTTVPLFVAAEKDTSELYTIADIKNIVNGYISARGLINANDQQYINVGTDQALANAVSIKGEDTPEFMKRDDVLKRVRANMQTWHEIRVEGRDTVRKKGEVKPISVLVKIRQGRKACTLVTGYEPFGLQADDLAEELRKVCASSTSVSPLHGKPNALEVMVQGKQIKAVTDLLIARGMPKKWIQCEDQSEQKKKK